MLATAQGRQRGLGSDAPQVTLMLHAAAQRLQTHLQQKRQEPSPGGCRG